MLIGALFMGHKVGPTRVTAAVLGFAGVLLVLNPFAGGLNLLALIPVTSGLFYAIGALATRQWCEGESTLSLLLYFFLSLGGLFGLIGAATFSALALDVPAGGAEGFLTRGLVWPSARTWGGLLLVQSGGAVVAMWLLFRGYQLGEAAQVAIFEYALLIFAAFWGGYLMFGQTLTSMAVLGMGLIAVSGAVISLRSTQPAPPDSTPPMDPPHGGGLAPP